MRLLIDGDIIAYKAACAAESVSYSVRNRGSEDQIDRKKEGKETLIKQVGSKLIKTRIIEGPHAAISNAKNKIRTILRNVEHEDFTLFLSSPKSEVNRRSKIAKRLPYKADRPGKPENLLPVREYMLNNYDTVVAKKGEADDLLGIYQDQDTAIVSIDKDLLQIPGNHVHLDSYKSIIVSDPGTISLRRNGSKSELSGTGFMWFCAQLLIGDRIDSIVGIPGCGPVECHRLLSTAKTEEEAWNIVVKRYEREVKYGTPEQRYAGLCEMARLAWIARSDDTLYSPFINGNYLIPRIPNDD